MHHAANTFLAMLSQFLVYEHCTVGRIDTVAQMLEDFSVQIRIAYSVIGRGNLLHHGQCLLDRRYGKNVIVITQMADESLLAWGMNCTAKRIGKTEGGEVGVSLRRLMDLSHEVPVEAAPVDESYIS